MENLYYSNLKIVAYLQCSRDLIFLTDLSLITDLVYIFFWLPHKSELLLCNSMCVTLFYYLSSVFKLMFYLMNIIVVISLFSDIKNYSSSCGYPTEVWATYAIRSIWISNIFILVFVLQQQLWNICLINQNCPFRTFFSDSSHSDIK